MEGCPQFKNSTLLSALTTAPDDLFICALGFEPRCLTLPKLLAETGYRSARVVFFEYDTNVDQNEANRQELTRYLNAISDSIQPLSLSDPDYPNELRRILECISSTAIGNNPRVTFDLSVAANRIVVTDYGHTLSGRGSSQMFFTLKRLHTTLPNLNMRVNRRYGGTSLREASSAA